MKTYVTEDGKILSDTDLGGLEEWEQQQAYACGDSWHKKYVKGKAEIVDDYWMNTADANRLRREEAKEKKRDSEIFLKEKEEQAAEERIELDASAITQKGFRTLEKERLSHYNLESILKDYPELEKTIQVLAFKIIIAKEKITAQSLREKLKRYNKLATEYLIEI